LRTPPTFRTRRPGGDPPFDLAALLRQRLIGQTAAIDAIVPYVEMFQAGLAPDGRPVGVFLLLGPSGTGKTRTVEALAEVLHGSERNVLKIDCGEFQMEHEVAKLIGAPPGYLGHRETTPMLSQQKVNSVASDRCDLSLVLFDEIEKAAGSMARLMLGVLDKATLKLGDNTSVNFEKSMIFMTSNLGAQSMMRELQHGWGFEKIAAVPRGDVGKKLDAIAQHAARRRFAPEFINRIDSMVTYEPLGAEAIEKILDLQLAGLQRHLFERMGPVAFSITTDEKARAWLIEKGTSLEFGARELKRTIQRNILQPLAGFVSRGGIPPLSLVTVTMEENGTKPAFLLSPGTRSRSPRAA
jgi:ATP-dependent Clp protease ATP-binding subunit ClpA